MRTTSESESQTCESNIASIASNGLSSLHRYEVLQEVSQDLVVYLLQGHGDPPLFLSRSGSSISAKTFPIVASNGLSPTRHTIEWRWVTESPSLPTPCGIPYLIKIHIMSNRSGFLTSPFRSPFLNDLYVSKSQQSRA